MEVEWLFAVTMAPPAKMVAVFGGGYGWGIGALASWLLVGHWARPGRSDCKADGVADVSSC